MRIFIYFYMELLGLMLKVDLERFQLMLQVNYGVLMVQVTSSDMMDLTSLIFLEL